LTTRDKEIQTVKNWMEGLTMNLVPEDLLPVHISAMIQKLHFSTNQRPAFDI